MDRISNYYRKHPKARIILDKINDVSNGMQIFSWLSTAFIISLFVIALYISLPDDFKKPISIIVGTVFTTLAIPLLISKNNEQNEARKTNYEKCSSYYEELIKLIVSALQHSEVNERKTKINTLSKYLNDNYHYFCLYFGSNILIPLKDLKKECDYFKDNEAKDSLENIIYYSEKCLAMIRKQGNIKGGKVFFNTAFIKID